MPNKSPLLAIAWALSLAAVAGCGTSTPDKNSSGATPGASAATAAAEQDVSGLKELDEADRKLAEKQKYCPKTGELLGAMGKPYKITLSGRTFFLCCDGCKEAVEKDPEKYLKKLDELVKDK